MAEYRFSWSHICCFVLLWFILSAGVSSIFQSVTAQPDHIVKSKVTVSNEVLPKSNGNLWVCVNISSKVPDIGSLNFSYVRIYCPGHVACGGGWTNNINDWKAGIASLDYNLDSFWKQGFLNDCAKVKYSNLPPIAYVELVRLNNDRNSEILDMVTIYGDTRNQPARDVYYKKLKDWGFNSGGESWINDSYSL